MNNSNMFDMFADEFDKVQANPNLVDNEIDTNLIFSLREEREKSLASGACRSSMSQGRLTEESPCIVRSCYERDIGRIIYSEAFRRLRHKTQVFFNPNNDHFCSRIEHVNYVSYISCIIGRGLNLNTDLIQAIALGHDVGHAPFGHSGERMLSECLKKVNPQLSFSHEVQSLRVLDYLEEHNNHYGLNLTFEVRDGIVSHCGESYGEQALFPRRDKVKEKLYEYATDRTIAPATLEGCVVRFADKIAYVGRDMEDAMRAGILDNIESFPKEIMTRLGSGNSQIINTLVADIIHTSRKLGGDVISLSDNNFEAFNKLLICSKDNIYLNERIKTYEKKTNLIIEELFNKFSDLLDDAINDCEKLLNSNNDMVKQFAEYVKKHPKRENEDKIIIVSDYISGMTDNYATECFERIFGV
ncbi:MAG: HD domain-containing protein [Clostridia bacterium]|nr:HD domain-containing protein [Clostridia bacterium]